MRIAQVCPLYDPHVGGTETHVREISTRLARKHEVCILTALFRDALPREEDIGEVKVRRFRAWAPGDAYSLSRDLEKYLKHSNTFDIVHCHDYHTFFPLHVARTKKSNAVVFTPHYTGKGDTFLSSLLLIPYRYVARREVFGKCDKIICVSRWERDQLTHRFGLQNERTVVIPNGVHVHELANQTLVPPSQPRIIYGGALTKRKNVDKMIRSIRILADEYHIRALLAIFGVGPLESSLKRLIEELRLQNMVIISPPLSRREYFAELSSSSVFVMPSEYECYSISSAEAIVMGVPTVVSNSSALAEYVQAGLAFGIDTPVTSHSIASALYDALTNPRTKPVHVPEEILSWDTVTSRLERLYVECLKEQQTLHSQ